jgi:hypothetical protein
MVVTSLKGMPSPARQLQLVCRADDPAVDRSACTGLDCNGLSPASELDQDPVPSVIV